MKQVYRFKLKDKISPDVIEENIAFAIIAAEALYGTVKVRLHCAYLFDASKTVIIDCTHEVGETVAEIFTGRMIKTCGELSFSVEKVIRDTD